MKKLVAGGATFIARTHAANVAHMMQMLERAYDHQGFSVIECLSECVEFFPDVFDPANPRKGGSFEVIQEKKWDGTPEDELRHDVTDELGQLARVALHRHLARLQRLSHGVGAAGQQRHERAAGRPRVPERGGAARQR